MYDCTHCFNCVVACPKDVAPMNQIMRLRRIAGEDFKINDRNNGHRHEDAFVTLIRDYGLLHEAEILPRSYGGNSWFGKFHPEAQKELASSIGSAITAVMRGKISPKIAMFGHKLPKPAMDALKKIYEKVEGREQRVELNLYISGFEDEEPTHAPHSDDPTPQVVPDAGAPEATSDPEEPIEPPAGAAVDEHDQPKEPEPEAPEPPAEAAEPPAEEPEPPAQPAAEPEAPTGPADKSPTFPGPEESGSGDSPSESESEE
jgi:ferredoxin